MISINIKDIPHFLKDSCYVNTIKVPKEYNIKAKFQIKTDKHLHKMLNVLRFWKVTELPYIVYEYVLSYPETELDFDKYFPEDSFPLIKEVKFLISINKMPNANITNESITEMIIENDYLRLFKFAVKSEFEATNETLKLAAKHGSLSILKYMIDNNMYTTSDELLIKINTNIFNEAVCEATKHGHLHIIKYIVNSGLYENNSYRSISFAAAEYNQLECLKYAFEIKDHWNLDVLNRAIENDNIDCVKFCIEASKDKRDKISILDYGVLNDYKIRDSNLSTAIAFCNFDALQILISDVSNIDLRSHLMPNNESSFCGYSSNLYTKIVNNDKMDEDEKLKYIKLISSNGDVRSNLGKSFEHAAKKGYFKIIQYIYENGGNTSGWEKTFIKLGLLEAKKVLE